MAEHLLADAAERREFPQERLVVQQVDGAGAFAAGGQPAGDDQVVGDAAVFLEAAGDLVGDRGAHAVAEQDQRPVRQGHQHLGDPVGERTHLAHALLADAVLAARVLHGEVVVGVGQEGRPATVEAGAAARVREADQARRGVRALRPVAPQPVPGGGRRVGGRGGK